MELAYIMDKLKAARSLLAGKYKLDMESICAMRRELHKYPELRYEESETKKRLVNYLSAHCGILTKNIRSYAKTGFTYDMKGEGPARGSSQTIGFRADMDALPIIEQSTLAYKSVNRGVAHMCGHDGHMATLLGLASTVAAHKASVPSNKTVRLIFQPAEEGGHGAELMVKEGALEGVEEVYAMHSWSLPLGMFGIKKSGAMTTEMTRFRIDVKGVGSHGAYPENGKDPITAICQINSALHTVVSRGISRKEMAVCTIGDIHAGKAENVIPDFATMGGNIRTEKTKVSEEMKRQMERIVEHVSKGLGCEGTVRYTEVTPAVVNSPLPANALREAVSQTMGPEFLCEEGMNASEDFCYMTCKVPGALMLIGHAVPGEEIVMNHNPSFNFNEDLIAPAVLAWVKLIEGRFGCKLC